MSAWVTDETLPLPRSVYHRTKLQAEALLKNAANTRLVIRVLRMSRCFPEPADRMAIYRLTRGVDVRDVASAHVAALTNEGAVYQDFIISGSTPFHVEDCADLAVNPLTALANRIPTLVTAFEERGWPLPTCIDRVYTGDKAKNALKWQPRYGFEEVLAQLDRGSLEVLPVGAAISQREE